MIGSFLTAFIPLLVAMDAVGVLPIYISMIQEFDYDQKKSVLYQAVLTATIIGLLFLFLGKVVFRFLGITVSDFRVAGGLILLLLALSDLFSSDKKKQRAPDNIGVVPLGVPLIVGPATLTALVVQVDLVGYWITLAAFLTNMILAFFVFLSGGPIVRFLGKAGTQAVSKIANLLLAALGVMIIRMGVIEIIRQF